MLHLNAKITPGMRGIGGEKKALRVSEGDADRLFRRDGERLTHRERNSGQPSRSDAFCKATPKTL